MAIREFSDAAGMLWRVWAVLPAFAERRRQTPHPAPLQFGERRRRNEPRVRLPGDCSGGWLSFQGETERRRLAPIPAGWEMLGDSALEGLLQRAKHVGPPIRRLVE